MGAAAALLVIEDQRRRDEEERRHRGDMYYGRVAFSPSPAVSSHAQVVYTSHQQIAYGPAPEVRCLGCDHYFPSITLWQDHDCVLRLR